MARSWETKDDPDIADLLDVMYREEREKWYRGGTLAEREEWLADAEQRWRALRQAAKNRPPSDDTEDWETSTDELKAGLLEIHRKLQTGELVNVTAMPTNTATEKPNNTVGWLAVGFAVLERGLDVIGYHNLFVGAALFLVAFLCFLTWFVKHEKARRWRFGVRVTIAIIAALVYFSLIGRQLYRQYRVEAGSPPVTFNQPSSSPLTTTNGEKTTSDQRVFVDVDPVYFANLYRTHSTAQADVAAQSRIGKWIKTTGVIDDVRRDEFLGKVSAYVTVKIPTQDTWGMYLVLAKFTDPSFMERALTLNPGEQITLVGKIQRGDASGLFIEECEIVR